MTVYSGCFKKRDDVANEFDIELPATIHIIFAHYSAYDNADEGDYEMWARVIYFDHTDRQLYEVHGSHCSCYGLEGQWEPKQVTARDILSDIAKTQTYSGSVDETIRQRLIAALRQYAPPTA